MSKIADPLIELLAIKLYEHDANDGRWPPKAGSSSQSWMATCEEDREAYRRLARGEDEMQDNQP